MSRVTIELNKTVQERLRALIKENLEEHNMYTDDVLPVSAFLIKTKLSIFTTSLYTSH